jgi:molybdenum-dependent DNA-binding transcriptional regulator ModE
MSQSELFNRRALVKGHLLMSNKERQRKSALELAQSGKITLVEASRRMGLSYRQTLRVYEHFVAQGDAGLVHRRRGKPSNRAYPKTFREAVVQRYRDCYQIHGFGPTLAAEKLAEEGLQVDHETLRRWLLADGDWQKCRKHREHRTRRERRAHFGELVQMDGSHHDWFGLEHGKSCLMNMVDDATGKTMSLLAPQETTEAAMTLLRLWIERYGVPVALYTDRKNVYITEREPTLEEQLAGDKPLTAFGKACKKLGIEIIAAHSPQAKGRVERSNGTYQDRLVKELALGDITTLDGANKVLVGGFTDGLNDRFAVAPADALDYHRPLHKAVDLDDVFCHEEHRVVQNDWTVSHENRQYQVLKCNTPLPKPKDRILVRIHLDGRVQLLYREKKLVFLLVPPGQPRQKQDAKAQAPKPAARPTAPPPPPKKKWHANCDRLAVMRETTP